MGLASCELTTQASQEEAEPPEGNYFVAAYPPFSCWRRELVSQVHPLLACSTLPGRDQPFGLYVHVPFCVQRCQYCYYLSFADQSLRQMDQYLDMLLQELALYRNTAAFADRKLGFVYFGGGTPSVLPTASLRRLLAEMKTIFPWTGVEEATFECAPRSVTHGKLLALRQAGINRLSLGVQQLNDEVLRHNGRVHLVADVERAWAAIQAVGFVEVNVDLIVGLVGETDATFRESLARVIQMGPESITIYQLEIPLNTPLYRALRDGTLAGRLPTWETKRARLAEAFQQLEESGYRLRSAYAAARNHRHPRFVYQEDQYRGADVLGIGASAISYVAGAHYQNLTALESYQARVRDGQLPIGRAYLLNATERLVREFVLQLKLGRVEADRFRKQFGVEIGERFAEPLQDFAARGWLTYDRGAVTLTCEGHLRVDRMLPAFYLPEHQGLRYS